MTTIYETYLEEVKKIPADTLEGYIAEGSRINTLIGTNDIKEILRQSFIAMVEGELIEKRRILEEGTHCEVFDYVQSEVSRLGSELLKLKKN
jgi:hypothetical protein